MAIQSCGGARDCSGPDSCSFRQYKVRVWRGMPAARQLPMYMASLPSCSARCAAALFGCASASGSSAPICVMYLCRAMSLVRDVITWLSQQIPEEEGASCVSAGHSRRDWSEVRTNFSDPTGLQFLHRVRGTLPCGTNLKDNTGSHLHQAHKLLPGHAGNLLCCQCDSFLRQRHYQHRPVIVVFCRIEEPWNTLLRPLHTQASSGQSIPPPQDARVLSKHASQPDAAALETPALIRTLMLLPVLHAHSYLTLACHLICVA